MKSTLLTAWILFFAIACCGSAQAEISSAPPTPHCTAAELKQLARSAQTREQYSALADCYEQQQRAYLQRASEEMQEWERRSRSGMATAAKYPRPADSARNLCDYYQSKASETGRLSLKYRQLAAQEPAAKTRN